LHQSSASTTVLSPRKILTFWLPLAATWLMMAVEGPYVAAIIARLANPTANLAAYGVAFSLAFVAEAPILMVMTASNTLVADRQSFLAMRRFVYALNALLSTALAIGLLPPLFRFVTERLIGLPSDVSHLTHFALATLVLWPAAIGYRRFYQGILVRYHMPRRVAYGTIIRLVSMSVTAAGLALATPLPGAPVGAIALMTGVLAEAVASRWMAHTVVSALLDDRRAAAAEPLTPRAIARFYYPLALTSLISVAVNPMVTFFLGRSRSAIESLAILPVVGGLVFLFRSGGIAYQEVAVALMGASGKNERPVARTALLLAGVSALLLVAILFTPLAEVWFVGVSGLSPALGQFALWPARMIAIIPAFEYLLSFQRSRFILARHTRVVTIASAVEVCTIAALLTAGIAGLNMTGALAATTAMMVGRLAGNIFLFVPSVARSATQPVVSPEPVLGGR
jgi:hypothetical protein